MAGQPCKVGDMQAYVDGLNLLTIERANAHMDAHLAEQRYITSAELRQLGSAPAEEVRASLAEISQRENQRAAELRNFSMQEKQIVQAPANFTTIKSMDDHGLLSKALDTLGKWFERYDEYEARTNDV